MRQWHYSQQKEQRGPISEPELVHLFETGALPSDSLVWCEGMTDWVPAHDVDGLLSPTAITNSEDDLPAAEVTAFGSSYEPSGEQTRPWVRYWARMIDVTIFGVGAGLLLGLFYEPALEINDKLFGILTLFLYVFAEAAILAIWGSTPGKALFKVRLRNHDDSTLSYGEALGRAFSVWFRGLGLGLPLISLITQVIALNKLSAEGITTWDSEGNFTVSHREVGALRIIVAVLIFIGVVALAVYGEMAA